MPVATTNREPQDELRERALEIGAALLREGGLGHIKARVLAVRLNVSVGTIYNLFGQMDEFIYRLNGRAYDGLLAMAETALADARARQEDVTGQLLALSRAYLDFVSENPEEWGAVVTFLRRSSTVPPQWYRDKERKLRGLVEKTIAGIDGLDEESVEVKRLGRAMWGTVHGVTTISLRRDGLALPKDEVWKQIEFMIGAAARELTRDSAAAR